MKICRDMQIFEMNNSNKNDITSYGTTIDLHLQTKLNSLHRTDCH